MFKALKHMFRLSNHPHRYGKDIIVDAVPHVYNAPALMPLPTLEESTAAMNRSYFSEKQPKHIAGSIPAK